jgi:thiol-disulfide isomerase/thioredoxin
VVPISAQGLKQAIAAEHGHVVLVDFWATWCVPCEAEYPEFVRLQQKYGKLGLVVIAVSADQRHDVAGKVVPFLRSRHADFAQYLQQSKDPEDFIDAFDPNWYGDLPRAFLYDRNGRMVKEFAGPQREATFAAAIVRRLGSRI